MQLVIPQVLFVLGKGGVGRSTIAAALGAGFASRGERVLVAQWAVTDAISPWFGLPATGFAVQTLAPGLATRNYSMDAAFAEYFLDHLKARAFYRTVVANRHVRRAMAAAPGLAELMFLGNLMAVTTIDRICDRVIVDAPSMGHGASLLAMPRITRALGFGGLLALESGRVATMLGDPARSAAIVVTTPDELAIDETLEFWPRITRDLGRPPIAALINFSTTPLGALPADPRACAWYAALGAPASLAPLYAHLADRSQRERALVDRLHREAATYAVPDASLVEDEPAARAIVGRATSALEPLWSAS